MKQLIILFFFCIFLCFHSLKGQQYFGGGGALLDDGNPTRFEIEVSGLDSGQIDSLFGLETVCINLIHTWDSDLSIFLIAPDGAKVELSVGNGAEGDNYTNTCFNDNSDTYITAGCTPFEGSFIPQSPLGNVNNGQNGEGIWTLYIVDIYPFADTGELLDWSLTFGNNPGKPLLFESSNLPIFEIITNGQNILDEPKIIADLKVHYNEDGSRNFLNGTEKLHYDGKIGIELRGSSSMSFPKKCFAIELCDANGEEVNFSLLGLPKESDWPLLANYSDKSLLRNMLAYKLFGDMGNYSPRTRIVELVIDGLYYGVYNLVEKIKRDKNRINIEKLEPEDDKYPEIKGGYILEMNFPDEEHECFASSFMPPNGSSYPILYLYNYPKNEDLNLQQRAYIKLYIDEFESVLNSDDFADTINGYAKYIDVNSFIDYFILTEVTRNIDGYRKSVYFYKSRYGKLVMGPPWDYDIALGNADYCDASNPQGFQYPFPDSASSLQVPFWWRRLLQDTTFANKLQCRYRELRLNTLKIENLYHWIDSVAAACRESVDRNFRRWKILGFYVWPNPSPIPDDYDGEIKFLKYWLGAHLLWLDLFMPGICSPLSDVDESNSNEKITVYPMPFQSGFNLTFENDYSGEVGLALYNQAGSMVYWKIIDKYDFGVINTEIDLSAVNLSAGVYFLKIISGDDVKTVKIIKN